MPVTHLTLPHLPPTLNLYISTYTSVANSAAIRTQLLASNQRYNYAFIDATTILSRRHLLSACFRAMNDYTHERLKSNNLQSEVVLCLSPNNNIGDAFRRFGIADGSTHVIAVKIVDATADEASAEGNETINAQSIQEFLSTAVEGTEAEFDDEWFRSVCDLDKVRKNYKIAKPNVQKGGKTVNGDLHVPDENTDVEVQVLGHMALRGAT